MPTVSYYGEHCIQTEFSIAKAETHCHKPCSELTRETSVNIFFQLWQEVSADKRKRSKVSGAAEVKK